MTRLVCLRVHDAEYVVDVISGSDRTQATLSNGTLRVPVKGRGVTALIIQRLQVTPAFQNTIADLDESTAWARDLVELTGAPGKAMILNLGSASRFAYVFLEYSKHDYTKVELVYQTASGEKRAEDTEFPWEVTVPLDGESDKFCVCAQWLQAQWRGRRDSSRERSTKGSNRD